MEHQVTIPPYLTIRRFFRYRLSDYLKHVNMIPCKETYIEDHLLVSSKLSYSSTVDLISEEQVSLEEFKLPVNKENKYLELVHTTL